MICPLGPFSGGCPGRFQTLLGVGREQASNRFGEPGLFGLERLQPIPHLFGIEVDQGLEQLQGAAGYLG